jgi:2-keto-3-deoxy-L-rhamnonate aldolase RhmA
MSIMQQNRLLERLRAGQVCLGVANTYPAPGIIEGMCRGWDFVWIDGQHGQFSYDEVLNATRTATAAGIDSLLRAPGQEHSTLCLFADMAPQAIMVPMVNTAAEAEHVVRGLRFPPRGVRSIGGRRMADLYGRDYPKVATLAVVVQIETEEAVANADAIAAVDGVDCLFFGPSDMRMSMGIPMDTPITGDARLLRAMEQVGQAAQRHGRSAGSVCHTPEVVKLAIRLGYRLLAGGVDAGFISVGASTRLSELRAAVGA